MKYEKQALQDLENYDIDYRKMLVDALKRFTEKPENVENFSSYLDRHFYKWLDKFANNPLSFICELDQFSKVVD